jgi:hypothetical protein
MMWMRTGKMDDGLVMNTPSFSKVAKSINLGLKMFGKNWKKI